MIRLRSAGLLAALLLGGCAARTSNQGDLTATLEHIVRTGRGLPLQLEPDERERLEQLYRSNGMSLIWHNARGKPNRTGREARELLGHAEREGLRPADYAIERIDSLGTAAAEEKEPALIARADAALSAALLRFLQHVHVGRVSPREAGVSIPAPRERHDYLELLRDGLNRGELKSVMEGLRPELEQYRLALEALARLRNRVSDSAGKAPLNLPVPLKPGSPAPPEQLGLLASRLAQTGDLSRIPEKPLLYEGDLVSGVQRLQSRMGLAPDGVIGKETLAELNIPAEVRVRQLEMALERLRWIGDLPDEPLVLVNIPMFELTAWRSPFRPGPPDFRSGVIVGKALNTETPVMIEEMQYVVFQPYWNVPQSIAVGEILPALEKDRHYLVKQNMEIVDGQSDGATPVPASDNALARVAEGTLRIRQRPGPANSLGPVKFMFPNRQNVYLHGTPAQELFDRSRRDFSHGCVRVEDPLGLAEWVLREKPDWTRDRIQQAMEDGSSISRSVSLPRRLTVILFYSTAFVDPDGTARFARDIYGHDRRLERALARVGP